MLEKQTKWLLTEIRKRPRAAAARGTPARNLSSSGDSEELNDDDLVDNDDEDEPSDDSVPSDAGADVIFGDLVDERDGQMYIHQRKSKRLQQPQQKETLTRTTVALDEALRLGRRRRRKTKKDK